MVALKLDAGRVYRSGDRLESLIASHPGHDLVRRRRDHPWRMCGGEQRRVERGRAALSDGLRHTERRNDHRPVHRAIRLPQTCGYADDGDCHDRAGAARDGVDCTPAVSTRNCVGFNSAGSTQDRNRRSPAGATRDGIFNAPPGSARSRRSRATASPGTRARHSRRLRHHGQGADDRSVHRVVWTQAPRRPVSVRSCTEPSPGIRQR
jgi:hypothetical protein